MELRELSTKIQIKLHQYSKRFGSSFKRPEKKFIEQMICGNGFQNQACRLSVIISGNANI